MCRYRTLQHYYFYEITPTVLIASTACRSALQAADASADCRGTKFISILQHILQGGAGNDGMLECACA